MKLKTWNELQVGDKVTVRTVEEMLSLKNVQVDNVGDLLLSDSKTINGYFIVDFEYRKRMGCFCGNTYTISSIDDGKYLQLYEDSKHWNFTRKMLRDEVIKYEA